MNPRDPMPAISRLAPLALALFAAATLHAEEPSWQPNIYPEDQLFASFIVSTAMINLPEEDRPSWGDRHLGEEDGVIGADIENVPKGAKITVEVKKGPFINGGKITAKAPSAGLWTVHPKIAYDFDALVKVRQPRPINITMEVSIDGVSLGEQTQTVVLRSINDCLWAVDEGNDTVTDYGYLFAAYVNENHPWVDMILREALETGIVDSFSGYQDEDPEQVLLQMYAIWDVMQRRGMKYSSITETASESDTVLSQHVRLFDDAIRAKQANCVDGTVLLAAIYRKIGLHPMLVSVPGHMYLAVALDPEDEFTVGLETTIMGAKMADSEEESKVVPAALREAWGERKSWNSFEAAVDYATANLAKAMKKFAKKNQIEYQLTDVAEARRHGILPIISAEDGKDLEAITDSDDESTESVSDEDDGEEETEDEEE